MSESEPFELDERKSTLINEGLAYIEQYAGSPFAERARRLVEFLKEKGLEVERSRTFGDVIYTTPEGWGKTILWNEEARQTDEGAVW
jgi:hypothetical protein